MDTDTDTDTGNAEMARRTARDLRETAARCLAAAADLLDRLADLLIPQALVDAAHQQWGVES